MNKTMKFFSLVVFSIFLAAGTSVFAGKQATPIPHPVDGQHEDCLSCHETGKEVDGKKAKKTPHPKMKKCQSCHKPAK